MFLGLVSVEQSRLVKIYQRELIVTQLTIFANVRRVSILVLECRLVNFVTLRLIVVMESANVHRLLMHVAYLVKLVFPGPASVELLHPVKTCQREHTAMQIITSANVLRLLLHVVYQAKHAFLGPVSVDPLHPAKV